MTTLLSSYILRIEVWPMFEEFFNNALGIKNKKLFGPDLDSPQSRDTFPYPYHAQSACKSEFIGA